MSAFFRRADGSVGHAHLVVRIVIALAVALLSLPLLSTSAQAEGEGDGTSTGQTTDPATDPPPADPPAEEPAPAPAEEPPAEEAPAEEPAPSPAPDEPAAEQPAAGQPAEPTTKTETKATQPTVQQSAIEPDATADAAPDAGSSCAASFDQNTQEDRGGAWINGALNQNNSNYAEGDYVPQRVELTELTTGTHTLTFSYDRTKNGKFAYDFVDHLGISGSAGASVSWDAAAPNPPMPFAETVFVTITYTIVANDPTATLIWDGHIASELDYGPNTGAASISGAPYHFSLTDMSCGNVGQQDNQLMADAVDFGFITVVKDAQPNDAQDFHFTLDAPNDLNTAFALDDDSDGTLPNSVTYHVPPGATTATEVNIPGGWTLTDITCTKDGVEVGSAVTVTLADDERVTCTFTNSRESSLEVDKYWVINGGTPVKEGSEPAHLGLGAQLTVNGQNRPWDTSITGFLHGASVSLNESVTFGNELCRWKDTLVQGRVTEDNGQVVDGALPYTDTLGGGSNHYTITNAVKCDGRLTLEKKVVNGDASASAWTLSATRSGTGLQYESGPTGVRHRVTAGSPYALGEDDADSRYEQYGAWTCTEYGTVTTLNGVQSVAVEAGRDATCTVKNATGELKLVKDVQNSNGGSAVASDFTLTATGDEGTIHNVTGSESGTTVFVDPGESFSLTESSLAGYELAGISCDDGQDPDSVEVPANTVVTCTFVNVDQHFTLDKAVQLLNDAGHPGDGDGDAEPGELLEYSLTVVNDSQADLDDAVVTDDLTGVLLYADMVSSAQELADQGLVLEGNTLTLTFDLAAGQSLTVRYTVEIKDGAWGITLHNVATPDAPGECIPPGDVPGEGPDDLTECTTDTPTPPVTEMPIQKVDQESGEVLPGATFQLWSHPDGCTAPGVVGEAGDLIGPDDELLATEVTGADGLALFEDLQHGCYLLVETDAPEGWADPVVNAMEILIDESNFVSGGEMATTVIGNFAEGLLQVVAKRQYELIDSEWVVSDGEVGYGDVVKYQVEVAATGPKNFHDVQVTDYVPGFNPDDEVSTLDAILDENSIACVGALPCTTSFDPESHLVTWDLGDLEPGPGKKIGAIAEMVVKFPDRPGIVAPGVTITDSLWNVGYLRWVELQAAPITGGPGEGVEVPHELTSNEVVVTASYSQPPLAIKDCKTNPEMEKCKKLPDTGAQAHLVQLAGLGALVLGLGLALVTRRRKDEEQA